MQLPGNPSCAIRLLLEPYGKVSWSQRRDLLTPIYAKDSARASFGCDNSSQDTLRIDLYGQHWNARVWHPCIIDRHLSSTK